MVDSVPFDQCPISMDLPKPLEETEPSADGPGALLRRARKAASLEQEDVAKQLKLNVSLVDALERDDYRDMPPATFVRGYLSAYAKLVKVDLGEIMARFKVGPDQVESLSARGMPSHQVSKGEPSAPVAPSVVVISTYVMVIALGVLALLWWLDDMSRSSDAVERSDDAAAVVTPAPQANDAGPVAASPVDAAASRQTPASLVEDPSPVEASMEASPQDVTDAADDPAPEPDAAALADAIALSLRLDDPNAPGVADAESRVEPQAHTAPQRTSASAARLDTETNTEAAELEAALEVGNVGADRLTLDVKDDCWVSVVDSRDRRLLYRVVQGGRQIDVQGDAPFRITLGNAEAVDVRFNGEAFDHSDFHKGNIARFLIPATNP